MNLRVLRAEATLVEDDLELPAEDLLDRRDDVTDGVRLARAEIDRLPDGARTLFRGQVGPHRVPDVEEVAAGLKGADLHDGPGERLRNDRGDDRAGRLARAEVVEGA